MGLGFVYQEGQTPIAEEELDGLKINSITLQWQLDELEQQNIEDALLWLQKKKLNAAYLLTEEFICLLHKKMYQNVWKWAGKFRKTEKNIGVPFYEIPIALKYLLDDTLFWIAEKVYPPEEIAIRCKHRLVSIHCFPNGNGRHSRVLADLIVSKLFELPIFSWGRNNLSRKNIARDQYIAAVKLGDQHDFEPLLRFARS